MLPPFNQNQLKGIVDGFRRMPGKASSVQQNAYYPANGSAGHHHSLDEVEALFEQLNNSGFISTFDWAQWAQTMPQGWQTDANLLNNADVDTLRSLITAHQRIERTSEGHIDALFASGYLDKFFDRLEQLAP